MRLPTFPTPYVRAWPEHPLGVRVDELEPSELFTRSFASDAHFAAYELPPESPRRRLSTAAAAQLDTPPVMRLLVVDVDAPAHAATDAWRDELRELSRHLPGDPFGYFTRGGARLVWTIEPFAVTDADGWARWFLTALVTLAAVSGIVADPACHDWTRLYRAPHATRDGVLQAHGWVCGSPHAIGAWPSPSIHEGELLATLGWLAATSEAWRRRVPRLAPPPPPRQSMRPIVVTSDGSRALRWGAEQVVLASAGDRNTELFRRTRWLAQLVERGELSRSVVADTMINAGHAAGLVPHEVRRTVASALRRKTT